MPKRLIILATALALGATACGPAYYRVDNDEEYVERAPPPPRVEVVPPMPGPAYAWIPGYWYWTGRGYVWQPGYYAVPPAPGHVWVRSGWVFYNGRYRYVPGRWARPGHVPHHQYQPPPPRRDRDDDRRPPPTHRPPPR